MEKAQEAAMKKGKSKNSKGPAFGKPRKMEHALEKFKGRGQLVDE